MILWLWVPLSQGRPVEGFALPLALPAAPPLRPQNAFPLCPSRSMLAGIGIARPPGQSHAGTGPPSVPCEMFPEGTGLIVADAYGGTLPQSDNPYVCFGAHSGRESGIARGPLGP